MSGRLPTFIGVGAMRAGTSAVSDLLKRHPDIYMLPSKESHFFDFNHERGVRWYQRQFADAGDAQQVGEWTPGYMYIEGCAERIASMVPDARLIAILRDPVDRAYSHYWFARLKHRENITFEEAISREDQRRAAGYYPWRMYLDRGHYDVQLDRLQAHFPSERILVLLYDDLQRDPGSVLGWIESFLGLPPMDRGDIPAAPEREYPPMASATRARLVELFTPGIERLERRLGRDLSVWKQG